jgi:hypothetical protein
MSTQEELQDLCDEQVDLVRKIVSASKSLEHVYEYFWELLEIARKCSLLPYDPKADAELAKYGRSIPAPERVSSLIAKVEDFLRWVDWAGDYLLRVGENAKKTHEKLLEEISKRN